MAQLKGTDRTKVCAECKHEKQGIEFYVRPSSGYLTAYCKPCHAVRAQRRYHAKPKLSREEVRRRNLSRYGITLEEYQARVDAQGGVCAICRLPEVRIDRRTGTQYSLAVDHCHATGVVRGLLCASCNSGLAAMRDDVERFRAAIEYLGGTVCALS